MRTQEETSPKVSDHEEGSDGSVERLISNDWEDPRDNYIESPTLPLDEEDLKRIIPALKDMDKDIGSAFKQSHDTVGPILKWITLTVIVYLMLFALPNTVFKSFPQVLCKIPHISGYYPHCARELDFVATPNFIRLAWVQSHLESVMEDSAGSSTVAVDMKDSEMDIQDLGMRIRHSSFASKDDLGRDLRLFINDAKATSGRLQEYGNLVGGVVDRIVSENEHTLRMLEVKPLGKHGGTPDTILDSRMLVRHETAAVVRGGLEDLWLQGVELLDRSLYKLIHESRINVGFLQNLEVKLSVTQHMITAEEDKIRDEERTLMWLLWRRWFKNEKKLLSDSVTLLQKVHDDCQRALRHLTGGLHILEQMSNDLVNLKKEQKHPRL